MNIFHKVTFRTLTKNRVRTVVTIIGILLSAAMLTAVTASLTSFETYMTRGFMYHNGNWHARISAGDKETFEAIADTEGIEAVTAVERLGYARIPDGQLTDKAFFYVLGMEQTAEQEDAMLPVHLHTGRFPRHAEELMLPVHLNRESGTSYQIGDTIEMKLGARLYDGRELTQNDTFPLHQNGTLQSEEEIFAERETRTYTIVGFYQSLPDDFEHYNSPGFTALTIRDAELSDRYRYDLYFRAENPRNVMELLSDETLPFYGKEVKRNTELLMCYGEAPLASVGKMMYSLAAILIGLIMFGSVSLIYNAFSISVSERTKQFGLLSSIGATRRQMRQMVFYEAFVLSSIGIPLGILSGLAGIGITFFFIGDRFRALGYPFDLTLTVSLPQMLLTVVIALVTVLISAWIPSKRAAKVSAVEALRQTNDIKMQNRPHRPSALTTHLFGLPGVLAEKYYHRSKKKYRATVVSLFMSIVLFVSAMTFTDYLWIVNGGMDSVRHDLSAMYIQKTKDSIPDLELLPGIRQLDAVSDAALVRNQYATLEIDQSSFSEQVLTENHVFGVSDPDAENRCTVGANLTFVDDDTFRALLAAHHLSEETFLDPDHPLAVVTDRIQTYNGETGKYEVVRYFKTKTPEIRIQHPRSLDGYWFLCLSENAEGKEVALYQKNDGMDGAGGGDYLELPKEEALYAVPLHAGAVITDHPYYIDNAVVRVIYPVSAAKTLFADYDETEQTSAFYLRSDNHAKTYTELNAFFEEQGLYQVTVQDIAALRENQRSLAVIIRVLCIGFVVLISLIAAANVFNTIATNIGLRRREFAMLKSIGMSRKDFDRMMRYECLLYGSKALLSGLPVSAGIAYLNWKAIGNFYDIPFHLPWAFMCIAACGVFFVVFATMLYAMRKIKKDNPIDALKNENL